MSQIKNSYYNLDLHGNTIHNSGFEPVGTLPNSDLFTGRTVTLTTDGFVYHYGLSGWQKTNYFDLAGTSLVSNVAGFFAGPIPVNLTIAKQLLRTQTTFPASAPGSKFTAETAPLSEVVFTIKHKPPAGAEVNIATVTFAIGSVSGVLSMATGLVAAAGSYIRIVSPAATDDLAGFYMDLRGYSLLPVYV